MTYPDEFDIEAPEADVAEQLANADPNEDEEEDEDQGGTLQDIEAPEWDVQEQSQTVHLDDDYT
jgi:hypothetical protein